MFRYLLVLYANVYGKIVAYVVARELISILPYLHWWCTVKHKSS